MRVCGVTVLCACVWCDGIVHTVCVIIEIAVRLLFYKSVNQACPRQLLLKGLLLMLGFVVCYCFVSV